MKTVDNQWIPLRYTVTKKSGESHAVSTGILTAGAAVVFWPAAPVFLLRKGHDITINKGVAFDVFTDANFTVGATAAAASNLLAASERLPIPATPSAAAATLLITSTSSAADIELDGVFVGNPPTTLQVSAGEHRIAVKHGIKTWQRTIQVNPGSTITLNAAP